MNGTSRQGVSRGRFCLFSALLLLVPAAASGAVALVEAGHILTQIVDSGVPLHPSQSVLGSAACPGDIESIGIDPGTGTLYVQLSTGGSTCVASVTPGGVVTVLNPATGFNLTERGTDLHYDPSLDLIVTQDLTPPSIVTVHPVTGAVGVYSPAIFVGGTFGMDFSKGIGDVSAGNIVFTTDAGGNGIYSAMFGGAASTLLVVPPSPGDDLVIQPDGDWVHLADSGNVFRTFSPVAPHPNSPSPTGLNLVTIFSAAGLPVAFGTRAAACPTTGEFYLSYSGGGTGGSGIFRINEGVTTATHLLTISGGEGLHDLTVGRSSGGFGTSLYFTVGQTSREVWEVTLPECPPPCGDGIVDAGEECDLGSLNGSPQSCCSATCTNVCGACCDRAQLGGFCTDDALPADCMGTQLVFFPGEDCVDVEARGDCQEHTGACCDGTTGTCTDNVHETNCLSGAIGTLDVLSVDCTPFVSPNNTSFGPDNTMGMSLQQVDQGGEFNVTEVTPAVFRAMTSAQLAAFDLIAINNNPRRLGGDCGDPLGLGTTWHSVIGVTGGARVFLCSHDAARFKIIVPPGLGFFGQGSPGPGIEPFGADDIIRQAALWAGGGTRTGLMIFNDSARFFTVGGVGWDNPEMNLPAAWGISDLDQISGGIGDGGYTDILPAYQSHPIYIGLSDARFGVNSISTFAANASDNSGHSIFRTYDATIFTPTEVVINAGVVDVGGYNAAFGIGSNIAWPGPDGSAISLIREEAGLDDQWTWVKDADCDTLNPPCTEHTGACCDGNTGTCTNNVPQSQCLPARLYASTPSQGGNQLLTIDPNTGAGMIIGPFAGALGSVTEIEWSPDGSTLYATTGGGTSWIHTIDPATGTVVSTVAHPFGALNGLEFDAGGTLLGAFIPGPGGPSDLVTVNTTTGGLTSIGSTGVSNIGGLAFNSSFTTLYGISSGPGAVPPVLLSVNPANGVATSIATTTMSVEASSLEFTADGRLITGGEDGNLYEISIPSGVATVIGAMGVPKVSGLSLEPGAVSDQLTWTKDTLCENLNPPCTEHTGACCDGTTGTCTNNVPESQCPTGECTGEPIIDSDGTASAGPGGSSSVEVRCGDPIIRLNATTNFAGLDTLNPNFGPFSGPHPWMFGPAGGDDLHLEDPTGDPNGGGTCPTAIRNGVYDLGADCVVLDLDGSLFNGQGVACDNACDDLLSFHDRNSNGFYNDGEDIVLDVNGDGIYGTPGDPDNQNRWAKDTLCENLNPPCTEHTGACCDGTTGTCTNNVPESECPTGVCTGEPIIDSDGTASAGPGGSSSVEVRCGDPIIRLNATSNVSGLDTLNPNFGPFSGPHPWMFGPAGGDDIHLEDPFDDPDGVVSTCPTANRNGVYDLGADCVVLDLDGSLFNGQGVACDNACDDLLSFYDRNGNGWYNDGEDIVLDVNGDGIYGTPGDPDNQNRWAKDTLCENLNPPCTEHTGACCDGNTATCTDNVPESECPTGECTGEPIIDSDGTASAGPGGTTSVQVQCGDPIIRLNATSNVSGLDTLNPNFGPFSGPHPWMFGPAGGDDIHLEDPFADPDGGGLTCPTANRNGVYDLGADCVVLDLDGSLFNGQGVACDNACDDLLSFHDLNGNGWYNDGEDIVLDVNADGIFGTPGDPDNQNHWTKDTLCENLNPPCTEHTGACCDHALPGGQCEDNVPGSECTGDLVEFFKGETCADVEARGDCAGFIGACCDGESVTCEDGVVIFDCLAPKVFTADTLCADLNPPCFLTPDLDIRPGQCPNQFGPVFRLGASQFLMPISLIGSVDFVVADVDPTSLELVRADGAGTFVAPTGAPVAIDNATAFGGAACMCHTLGGDGTSDLRMMFGTTSMGYNLLLFGLANGAEEALQVIGRMNDGTPFRSNPDCVKRIHPRTLGPLAPVEIAP